MNDTLHKILVAGVVMALILTIYSFTMEPIPAFMGLFAGIIILAASFRYLPMKARRWIAGPRTFFDERTFLDE